MTLIFASNFFFFFFFQFAFTFFKFHQYLMIMEINVFYNHFHNILRHFDVLPNFSFTTSETMRDYYL